MNRFVAILRVRIEADGRLTPLWYSVRDHRDWSQMTVVNHEYTIALCPLHSSTIEDACSEFLANLSWFDPLLKNAEPEAWFLETGRTS